MILETQLLERIIKPSQNNTEFKLFTRLPILPVNKHDLYGRVARKKPPLSKEKMEAKLQLSRTQDFWSNVLWKDEVRKWRRWALTCSMIDENHGAGGVMIRGPQDLDTLS